MKPQRGERLAEILRDYLMIILGGIIYGFGMNSRLLPAQVPPGGFSGIAAILNYVFGWKIGAVILILNIPLLLIAGFRSRFFLVLRTMYATILMSLFVDLFAGIPPITENRLMSSAYGGLFTGLGLGIILLSGARSGGSDILAYAIQNKMKNISIAKILFALDITVITAYAAVIGDAESTLYAGASKFVSSEIINLLTSGGERSKTVFIITENPKADCQRDKLYSGQRCNTASRSGSVYRKTIAVKRNEAFKLKRIVTRMDPTAFKILSDSSEIWGKGFFRHSEQNSGNNVFVNGVV